MNSQDHSLQKASTVQPASTGEQPPTVPLSTGSLIVFVPMMIMLSMVIHRRYGAVQRQRQIAHLEKSWKLIPQNPQR